MSALSDALAASSAELIDDIGASVTFRRVSESSYNSATGTTTSGANQDETVRALFLQYREAEIDGQLIQRGDRRAIVSASGLTKTPAVGDVFVGKGDTVRVISVQKIEASGDGLVYACQVRE